MIFVVNFFESFVQEYHQRVKQFGTRSGPTRRRAADLGPAICKGHMYQQTTKVAAFKGKSRS